MPSSTIRSTRPRKSVTAGQLPPRVSEVIGDDNLLNEILVRLPARSLFRSKLVSKRWLSLISHPKMVISWKKPASPAAIFLRRNTPTIEVKFNYIPLLCDRVKKPSMRASLSLISLNFGHDPTGVEIIGSCNGLLLCTSFTYGAHFYYVHNPTTNKFTTIPSPHFSRHRGMLISMNLAFDPSLSLNYKLIFISSLCLTTHEHRILIYSSSSRHWKVLGILFSACQQDIVFNHGIYLNGAIHWPSRRSTSSIYFSLETETIEPMPMPTFNDGVHERKVKYFRESGGRLYFVDPMSAGASLINVFEMERDYSKWTTKYRVEIDVGAIFSDILRGNSTTSDDFFNVLSVVRGEVGGDSFMVLYIPGKVILYYFKDKTFKKVMDLKLRYCDAVCLDRCRWFFVHPCMETFYPV